MVVLRRTSFRLAALAAACLVASACADGGAFGPLPVDGAFVLSTGRPVRIDWGPPSPGAQTRDYVIAADTVVFLPDMTGELRTRYESINGTDTTRRDFVSPFTYTRTKDEITLRMQKWWWCEICAVAPPPETFLVVDGLLHRRIGLVLAPYRQIE